MSLAQVVYNLSTDKDFAAELSSDPEAALANRGLKLSKEEKEFLSKGLKHSEAGEKVRLSELGLASNWI